MSAPDLVTSSVADDEAAFAAVYRAYHQKLLRYCQYRLRDRHEAEDVMQEAFVRAWRSMPATAYSGSFYPWLRVVAGNLCTDILRKRSRSEPLADIEPGVVDGGMDRLTEEEERLLVRKAMLRLNDRHREALIMREDEGLTYEQIAERTGVTSGTVESLLWRARQALKREFAVVAGRPGAVVPLPVFGLAAARAAAARRRIAVALARRVPWLSRSTQESPCAHLAVCAIATLSLIGGIAATFEASKPPAAHAAVEAAAHAALGSEPATGLPDGVALLIDPALGSAASAAPRAAAGGSPAATVASGQVPAPAQKAARQALRLVNPVAVGAAPARYSRDAPVTVVAGIVAVGLSPTEISGYTSELAGRVTTAAGIGLRPFLPAKPKESSK